MKKGDNATLRMVKTLQSGSILDEREHSCRVLQYDEKKEKIWFSQISGELTELSLDAVYVCRIYEGNEQLECTGRIMERYCGENGKTFQFEIKNGFYKINLK